MNTTKFQGCIDRANELASRIPNSFIPQQFENMANPDIHYRTTGPEIWNQSQGMVDACVFGVGSGGDFLALFLDRYCFGLGNTLNGWVPFPLSFYKKDKCVVSRKMPVLLIRVP